MTFFLSKSDFKSSPQEQAMSSVLKESRRLPRHFGSLTNSPAFTFPVNPPVFDLILHATDSQSNNTAQTTNQKSNRTENDLGVEGAEALVPALHELKLLTHLDFGGLSILLFCLMFKRPDSSQ